MPTFQNGDAKIHYEEYGQGFPILTFASAGLMSRIEIWASDKAPINVITEYGGDYRVIVMDQRNAGRSSAPIRAGDGWHSYTADHLALLDHLGISKCHLYGQCIGGPFIWSLLKAQPQRVACAVAAQPSGRIGPMQPGRGALFQTWVNTLGDSHPEATDPVLDSFHDNLYGKGFLYSVDRAFLQSCKTPVMILAGNDEAHPYAISEEAAKLLPDVEFLPKWKTGAELEAARQAVKAFLSKHTPVK